MSSPAAVLQPLAGFLPPVTTKLTQSPWFLNAGLLNAIHPSFLHSSALVGGPTTSGTVKFGAHKVTIGVWPAVLGLWHNVPPPVPVAVSVSVTIIVEPAAQGAVGVIVKLVGVVITPVALQVPVTTMLEYAALPTRATFTAWPVAKERLALSWRVSTHSNVSEFPDVAHTLEVVAPVKCTALAGDTPIMPTPIVNVATKAAAMCLILIWTPHW